MKIAEDYLKDILKIISIDTYEEVIMEKLFDYLQKEKLINTDSYEVFQGINYSHPLWSNREKI